jgi:Holliday junction resolvasome RuvABC endonuclease subunit
MANKDISEISCLGFDTAKFHTGWALVKGMKVLAGGYLHCPDEFKRITVGDPEFSGLLSWLKTESYKLVKRFEPDFVAMEDLNIRFAPTAKVMNQLQAAVKIGVYEYGNHVTPVNTYHNQTIKSRFKIRYDKNHRDKRVEQLAKENKKYEASPVKILMVEAINNIFGLHLTYSYHDVADAVALAWTCIEEIQTLIIKENRENE